MFPIISNVDGHFSSDTRVPPIIITIDRPLLVVGTSQQFLIFILLGQLVRRHGKDEVVHLRGASRFGPNGLKIEKETTHVIVRWTRVASMA